MGIVIIIDVLDNLWDPLNKKSGTVHNLFFLFNLQFIKALRLTQKCPEVLSITSIKLSLNR